jgi:biopolymer transport protein ExbD
MVEVNDRRSFMGMTAGEGGRGGIQSEINVTPMVDIMLVLLSLVADKKNSTTANTALTASTWLGIARR